MQALTQQGDFVIILLLFTAKPKLHRNIADMESDGVYFDETLKVIVAEQMDVMDVELAPKLAKK